MHERMLLEIVKGVRKHQREGDRPTPPYFTLEQLEEAIDELAKRAGIMTLGITQEWLDRKIAEHPDADFSAGENTDG